MRYRPYYLERTDSPDGGVTIPPDRAWDQIVMLFDRFEAEGWFQHYFGYVCVDAGYVSGEIRGDVELYAYRRTLLEEIWPPSTEYPDKSLHAVFTLVEFLHDHIAKPTESRVHNFSGCGIHVHEADPEAGQTEWRSEVNDVLRYVEDGYELSEDGTVQLRGDRELRRLWQTPTPSVEPDHVDAKIEHAIQQFRRGRASWGERRQAIRELADVLEYLRNDAKEHLRSKDENDLFRIANQFAIRHNDQRQKGDYDPKVWLSWLFHIYLATCRALCEIRDRGEGDDAFRT